MEGLITLVLFVLFISVAFLTKRIGKITRPIHEITTTVQAAYSGNLTVKTNVKSGDELEILSNCFNKLTEDLQLHIDKLISDEKVKKQMQMDLLISQIHPHFIYNTLNSDIYLIEDEEYEESIEMIYALINILQNTVRIDSREIFSTLERELNLLTDYVMIASARYPERFTLEVECDSSLYREFVPKVLIQPLVENAINHGVIPSGSKGKIKVIIQHRDQWLFISVEDDGIGFDQGKLDAAMSRSSSDLHGVGLANIFNRISFLYNEAGYKFNIQSLTQGTRVEISLPMDALNK